MASNIVLEKALEMVCNSYIHANCNDKDKEILTKALYDFFIKKAEIELSGGE